jgi:uncharacterized protein YcfL
MKKLVAIIFSISLLFTVGCSNNQATSKEGKQKLVQDVLVLKSKTVDGYAFESTKYDSGAWVDTETINKYKVTNVSVGEEVRMVFNETGEILEVNGAIIRD